MKRRINYSQRSTYVGSHWPVEMFHPIENPRVLIIIDLNLIRSITTDISPVCTRRLSVHLSVHPSLSIYQFHPSPSQPPSMSSFMPAILFSSARSLSVALRGRNKERMCAVGRQKGTAALAGRRRGDGGRSGGNREVELNEHLCQLGRNRTGERRRSERVDKTGGPYRRDSRAP